MTSMYIFIIYSYSLKVVQRSAAIPDPRVDKRKAHAHNASLEGVARERESACSLCTLRERDFNTRCEYALCEREIERETTHVCADQFLSHSALHNFTPLYTHCIVHYRCPHSLVALVAYWLAHVSGKGSGSILALSVFLFFFFLLTYIFHLINYLYSHYSGIECPTTSMGPQVCKPLERKEPKVQSTIN